MRPVLLSDFSEEVQISERTLKSKYGDCIYREGRQSFIDPDKFDKAFTERSRKGKKSKGSILKSNHLGQVDFHISALQKQIDKCKRAVARAKKFFEETEDKDAKEERAIVYLREKKVLVRKQDKRRVLVTRRQELIQARKEELSSYDDEGLLGTF